MSSAADYSPSSSSMERDARRIHDDKPVSPGSIALGVVIGRMSEFFDFFVYGIASVLVQSRSGKVTCSAIRSPGPTRRG